MTDVENVTSCLFSLFDNPTVCSRTISSEARKVCGSKLPWTDTLSPSSPSFATAEDSLTRQSTAITSPAKPFSSA